MYFKTVALVTMLMLPICTFAQESNFGNWLIYLGNKQINSKWNWHNEVQYRNYDMIGDLEQLLLRTGLGYSFNEMKNNVLLGYGYILSENYNENSSESLTIHEHRIFQQFISKQNIGSLTLNHRYRFEQRFIENDFRLRIRYFLGLNFPLKGKTIVSKTPYLSVYDELFLNTKKGVFDRNRLFLGIGYKVNDNIKLEIGYMIQFFELASRDQLNIILFVNI